MTIDDSPHFSDYPGHSITDATFGLLKTDEPDLFSHQNGILMSTQAEKFSDQGHFAIVLLVADDASKEEVGLARTRIYMGLYAKSDMGLLAGYTFASAPNMDRHL